MNIFFTFFSADRKKGANWFRDNRATKLFVIIGFLLVILAIILAELKISTIYLSFANGYAPFGPAIALYSLKVAVFLLFVFAIISSTAISSSSLYQNSTLSHLFTLPIKPISIFISKVFPGFVTSTIILFLSLPLFLVFNKFIFKSPNFILIVTLGLFILSLISQALGTIFSTLIAFFLGKITRKKQFLFLTTLIGIFYLLIKLLFPKSLFHLADTDTYATFQSQLDKFPLMGKILPTNWLVDAFVGTFNYISAISILISVICLLIVVGIIGYKYYLTAWRRAQSQSYLAGNSLKNKKLNSHYPKITSLKNIYLPLIVNDFLAFFRSNSEINYLVFLGGLLTVLIFSIHNLTTLKETTLGLMLAINLIAYFSTSMIFLTASLRLIFPMIAREKTTAWFSFSLPISRQKYLLEKLFVAILLALPAIPIAIIIVSGLKLSSEAAFLSVLLIVATVVVINILQCLLGAINPNFKEAQNPEAISTSSLGVVSLMLSLAYIVFITAQLYGYLNGNITILEVAINWLLMTTVIVGPIFLVALRSLRKYSL